MRIVCSTSITWAPVSDNTWSPVKQAIRQADPPTTPTMSKGVKIEFDPTGSSGISQQTLEDAAGVADAGSDAVLPAGGRRSRRFINGYHRDSLESESGQYVSRRSSWLRVGSLVSGMIQRILFYSS